MAFTASKHDIIEYLSATGTKIGQDIPVEGVEFDSREISGGELFVALKGSQSHGHDFLDQALSKGASLFLVEDENLLSAFPSPERLVVVDDTLQAFLDLAHWWRVRLEVPVLGITGSIGKTTVKEMAASILSAYGPGTASLKSHNNQTGVPYTLCRISPTDTWAVVEMGMNHKGELRELTRVAAPDVAVITGIAPVHIGMFQSLEEIGRAKLEILEGLKPDKGIVVTPWRDEVLSRLMKEEDISRKFQVRSFGEEQGCNCIVSNIKGRGLEGIDFSLSLLDGTLDLSMDILGRHNAYNAACAALAATSLCPRLELKDIGEQLSQFSAPDMRLQIKPLGADSIIIDDSYNASPWAMQSALELVADIKQSGWKAGLVLGDMLELGDFAEHYHAEIGRSAAELTPEFLVAVGAHRKLLTLPSRDAGIAVLEAKDSSEPAITDFIRSKPFDVLLVKASRGVRLERIVAALLAA